MVLALLVFADAFVDAVARPVFERSVLVFALAEERTATLPVFSGGFLTARVDLLILAEIFASLPLLVELDLDDRRIALEGWLDAFLGVFFLVDMADLLLTSSALGNAISSRPSRLDPSQPVRSYSALLPIPGGAAQARLADNSRGKRTRPPPGPANIDLRRQ